MQNNKIIILHDLNGKPYYEAVEFYANNYNIQVSYYESSIFKLFIRDIVKKQFSFNTLKRSMKNLIFRMQVPFMKNKTIIIGMGPYDFRIAWYRLLMKNNNVIYHTSHPFWGNEDKNPRQYSIFTPLFKNIWKDFLSKKGLKIVTVTKSSFNTLTNNFKLHGRVTQIYHTVDVSKFKVNYNKDDEKYHILFVGKLLYEKGLDTIVELVKTLDKTKFHFHIVGDGEYRKKIEYIFKNENVTYYGWIGDKTKLSQIYQKCHIFLNPSIKNNKWQELFGIVNIEAMASGLVVIASNHIGPSEIIENGVNGFLVEERDSSVISKIINILFDDKELFQTVSKNAINSSNLYSLDSISKQWEKIINE